MMSRLFRVLGALALFAVIAAVGASPAAADRPEAPHDVPFRGVSSGTDSYGPPSDCPAPGASWRYSNAGTGEFAHLGAVASEVTHCTWFDSPTTGHFGPGTNILTAANGDTLTLTQWGTFELLVTDGVVSHSHADLHWTVLEGTGRFDGASGAGTAEVTTVIATDMTTAHFTGTIAYDARAR
jgi:hypothetical protein